MELRYRPLGLDNLQERLASARALGAEPSLVLHGGGNVSMKGEHTDLFGQPRPCLWVKASGKDLKQLGPEGLTAFDLGALLELKGLMELSDPRMTQELAKRQFDLEQAPGSIETLVHAFLPPKFVDHTHADAILVLTSHAQGRQWAEQLYGKRVEILDYCKAGFQLALECQRAYQANPEAQGLILLGHGVITWGDNAQESYQRMLELVQMAEAEIQKRTQKPLPNPAAVDVAAAKAAALELVPKLRGALAKRFGKRLLFSSIQDAQILALLNMAEAESILNSPTLTPDHLIRTKPWPLFLKRSEDLEAALDTFATQYQAYVQTFGSDVGETQDAAPRMVLVPGVGAFGLGETKAESLIARDILHQTLLAKLAQWRMNCPFQGLPEKDLAGMEFRPMQQAKLSKARPTLQGKVGLITGTAGAIGSGIMHELLELGCHLVITDLAGQRFEEFSQPLLQSFGQQLRACPMDVTSPESVQAALDFAVEEFGGLDLLVINAGLAHVSTLDQMDLERFRLLERVNIEGTLLPLKACANLFKNQGSGGDVVLVSTKNVFSPSASFGAYSATKAASHQLARIASLELAPLDVRVNMVSPDGVFSDGEVKSGLWALVGPDRMKARGLDEKGLEEYYQGRNLLKAKVLASHVGKAVVYFATRQSPTTGATIPVDGGLPDATPR